MNRPLRSASAPVLNKSLLRDTLDVVQQEYVRRELDEPSRWTQAEWRLPEFVRVEDGEPDRCGSAMCFAGWAAQLDGGHWLLEKEADRRVFPWASNDLLLAAADDPADRVIRVLQHLPYGQTEVFATSARDRAMRLLGLTQLEADRLFDGVNSAMRLTFLVERLLAGEAITYDASDDTDHDMSLVYPTHEEAHEIAGRLEQMVEAERARRAQRTPVTAG